MNTIVVYTDNIKDKLTNEICDKFIFDNFTMVITSNEQDSFANIFDIATNCGDITDCSCRVILPNENGEFGIATEFNWIVNENCTKVIFKNEKDLDKYKEIASSWADYLVSIMTYIMIAKRKRIQKRKTDSNVKKNKDSSKDTKEYNQRKIYLLDEIVEYANENGLTSKPIGTREIHCPCWGVRGHYRHYKSGKVVFIKNYTKGKNKENLMPKDKIYTV